MLALNRLLSSIYLIKKRFLRVLSGSEACIHNKACGAGVNVKVMQAFYSHSRGDVTLDVYTTVIKELKQREFGALRKS